MAPEHLPNSNPNRPAAAAALAAAAAATPTTSSPPPHAPAAPSAHGTPPPFQRPITKPDPDVKDGSFDGPDVGSKSPPASGSSSRVPPRRRRDKPQLSCNLCRFKKLRCDRQQPCSTCSTRGLPCHYVADPATLVNAIDYRPRGRATSAAQDRIRHLERLVISLMEKSDQSESATSLAAEALLQSQAANSTPPPDPNLAGADSKADSALPDELGKLSLSDGTTTWVTSSHWAAVLDDIADLREHLEYKEGSATPDSKTETHHNNVEPELLYGSNRHATRDQILAAVPPKAIADDLVATFFNSLSGTYKVVHSRTFLVEYDEFWHSPGRLSIMWIGMLFSILALAQHFHDTGVASQVPDSSSQSMLPPQRPYDQPIGANVQRLRQKAVQCLVLGRYTHPSPRAVEALVVYLALEYILNPRSDSGILTLMSMIVRLSMQMGYHRDPSHFPSIKPLEAEMRRRTWISIFMLDLIISSSAGVPRMLKPWQSDVSEPRNLADEDLHEHMSELPPSRPEVEPSSMLFMITRYRIAAAFGIISDLATSTMQPSYTQILKADQGLLDAHKSIPRCYQPRSAADSIHDPPELIMHRIYISSVFRRAQCVLHRRFLQHGRAEPAFQQSRDICIRAALALLCLQRAVNEEIQPGRPLFAGRWRILTSVNNDFLLGTMIACGELQRRRKEAAASTTAIPNDDLAAELADALAAAHAIWASYGASWPEAAKAADATSIILGYASPGPDFNHSPHPHDWLAGTPPDLLKPGGAGLSGSSPAHMSQPHAYLPQDGMLPTFADTHSHSGGGGPFAPPHTGYYYPPQAGFDPMFAADLVHTRPSDAGAYYANMQPQVPSQTHDQTHPWHTGFS